MNLWEAIKALEEGKKIRRTDWPPDKYLQIKDGKYVVNEAGLCSSIFDSERVSSISGRDTSIRASALSRGSVSPVSRAA